MSNEKNRPLVGWVYKGDEILPSYVNVGDIINQYKDPYEPTSMEGTKGLDHCSCFFSRVLNERSQWLSRKSEAPKILQERLRLIEFRA